MSALHDAVDAGTEGLMLKRLDAPYEFSTGSTRSNAWVKLKKDYFDGFGRQLRSGCDRRLARARPEEQVGLAGVGRCERSGDGRPGQRLPRDERAQGRVLPGVHDPNVRRRDFGRPAAERRPAPQRTGAGRRDGRDVSILVRTTDRLGGQGRGPFAVAGPQGRRGLSSPTQRGISLRFPRFLRERPDKACRDAATFAEVAERYRAQSE